MTKTYVTVSFNSITFNQDDIRGAILIEEFNPLAITVPTSRLELLLYTEDPDFSIIDPTADYANLVYRQPMTVYVYVDTVPYFIGKYYLDDWNSVSENIIKFELVDEIGVLDDEPYNGGIWVTPTTAGALFNAILSPLGVDYEIDPDLVDIEIKGWLPISTVREALQQVAFAAGAYILTPRQSGYIKIGIHEATGAVTRGIRCGVAHAGQSRVYKKRWRASQWDLIRPVYDILNSEIGFNPTVTRRKKVTGVEVTTHDYAAGTETKTLLDQNKAVGTYKIEFLEPMHSLAITGATITESGANYCIIEVTTEGTVTITGDTYIETLTTAAVYDSGIGTNKTNIQRIKKATLIHAGIGSTIANRVYNYYQGRHVMEGKTFAHLAAIGDSVLIDTLENRQIRGIIEKATVDLSNGYLSNVTVIGDVEPL